MERRQTGITGQGRRFGLNSTLSATREDMAFDRLYRTRKTRREALLAQGFWWRVKGVPRPLIRAKRVGDQMYTIRRKPEGYDIRLGVEQVALAQTPAEAAKFFASLQPSPSGAGILGDSQNAATRPSPDTPPTDEDVAKAIEGRTRWQSGEVVRLSAGWYLKEDGGFVVLYRPGRKVNIKGGRSYHLSVKVRDVLVCSPHHGWVTTEEWAELRRERRDRKLAERAVARGRADERNADPDRNVDMRAGWDYDQRCSACWLGFPHTYRKHWASIDKYEANRQEA